MSEPTQPTAVLVWLTHHLIAPDPHAARPREAHFTHRIAHLYRPGWVYMRGMGWYWIDELSWTGDIHVHRAAVLGRRPAHLARIYLLEWGGELEGGHLLTEECARYGCDRGVAFEWMDVAAALPTMLRRAA